MFKGHPHAGKEKAVAKKMKIVHKIFYVEIETKDILIQMLLLILIIVKDQAKPQPQFLKQPLNTATITVSTTIGKISLFMTYPCTNLF